MTHCCYGYSLFYNITRIQSRYPTNALKEPFLLSGPISTVLCKRSRLSNKKFCLTNILEQHDIMMLHTDELQCACLPY